MCLLFAFCLEMPLASLAMNMKVIKGEVSQVEQKEVTKIYASDGSVIHYSSFEVQNDKEIQIIQPNKDSVVVIQVLSNQPTRIKNKLSANGIVYLVNPQGIFMDKNAKVDGESFYFIGSELLTDNVQTVLNIKPTSGDVVNHGTIRTNKDVYLMGRHVVNSGEIHALNRVSISKTNALSQLAVLHTGTIKSKEVLIEAFDGICELYGKIDAKNTVESQYGGTICILGQQIRLIGAYLDASGTFRGGQVNLGGDLAGQGTLFKASRTSVDHSSVIDVSAIEYGQGGQLVIWSQDLTSFEGEVYSRGGRSFGDGGLVETSSAGHLGICRGKVNVDAACGQNGTWVLDPSNIIIQDGDDGIDDLSQVTEYPAQNGSQVTVNVKAINNFSGGKLQISATNRITIDANIENISSTIDLSFIAGNQIRFKSEKVDVPNGKVSFIVENKDEGQIVCQKDFKKITAHELVVIAPKGEGNGFQVESPTLTLTTSLFARGNSNFLFNTDVIAKNNDKHQLILRSQDKELGQVSIQGSLKGFDLVDSQIHLSVEGQSDVGSMVTQGAANIELLGGGQILEQADFQNTKRLVLASPKGTSLKIQGGINATNASSLKLFGKIDCVGPFEAGEVKLLSHTFINSHNNPIVIHKNISQEAKIANLKLVSSQARIEVQGSIYVNNFEVYSKTAPTLCGEVCVYNFKAAVPELNLVHDLVVSGQIDCHNLTTKGENKKIAFAKGGVFKGKTKFDHTGTLTLGVDDEVCFNFDQNLDTQKQTTFTNGAIFTHGAIEMADLKLLGKTSLNCHDYPCQIFGSIEEQDCNAQLTIDTKNDQIIFDKYAKVSGLALTTSASLKMDIPVYVKTFSTTAPAIQFNNHLMVEDQLTTYNICTQGENSQITLLGNCEIKGSAEFNNGKSLVMGKNSQTLFKIENRLSCLKTLAKLQGQFEVQGPIDFLDIELLDHLQMSTNGHAFNVKQKVSQSLTTSNLEISTGNGEINFGQEVYVNNLKLFTTVPVYLAGKFEVVDLQTNSPLLTFAQDAIVKGLIDAKSIATLGRDKTFELSHGGLLDGDAKLANTGKVIIGKNESDKLLLTGPFDRSNGITLAQGTIHTQSSTVDIEELSLTGKLSILSVADLGEGENISFHSQINGSYPLLVHAGKAKIIFNDSLGHKEALMGLTVHAQLTVVKGDMTLEEAGGKFFTSIYLANNIKVMDRSKEGLFFFGRINGNYDLELISYEMVQIKKEIGSEMAVNAVTITAPKIQLAASIGANAGAIHFNGNVDLLDHIKVVNCGVSGICFNGKVNGDTVLELKVNDHKGSICFNEDVGNQTPLQHIILTTHAPLVLNKRFNVGNLETTSPLITFNHDVTVLGTLNTRSLAFEGTRQNVHLQKGGVILGNASFRNKGNLYLGMDDLSALEVQGILSRSDGPTYARGIIETKGPMLDIGTLHATGNLTLKSSHEEGSRFNFSATIDGEHQVKVQNEKGSVYFYDLVGYARPLAALEVEARVLHLQKDVQVSHGNIELLADVKLLNHSSLKSSQGKKILISGSLEGEYDLSVVASNPEAVLCINGTIGQREPINRLVLHTLQPLDFEQPITVYCLETTSPQLTFNSDVEIRKEIQAIDVCLASEKSNFAILEGGVIKGNLILNNSSAITTLGHHSSSTLTIDGALNVQSAHTLAQGVIETTSQPIKFEKITLTGPLKVASSALQTQGNSITFKSKVEGERHLEVDAGSSTVAFMETVGHEHKLKSLIVQGSQIIIDQNITVGDGFVTFKGDVELNQSILLSNEGAAAITFLGHLNGKNDLEVFNKNERGSIVFAKSVGGNVALQSLNLKTKNAIEFPSQVDVNNLITTSPTLTFADEVVVRDQVIAHNVIAKGKYRSVRFLGDGQFSGIAAFDRISSLVLGSKDSSKFNFCGPLSVLDGVLITQGEINTKGSVTLAELSLKGSTEFKTNNGDFNIVGVVEQLHDQANLSIDTQDGKISFGSKVCCNNLNISTKQSLEFYHPISVVDFITNANHVLFASNIVINGLIEAINVTTSGTNNKIQWLGGGILEGNVILKNGNGICFGAHDGAVLTFHGPVDTSASLLEVRGTIQTIDKTIDIGNVNILGNTTIRTMAEDSVGKDIYFMGFVDGGKQLRANAGQAKICFEKNVGSKKALESLQATASKIEVDCNVNAKGGNVVFAGDVVFTNTCNLTADENASIIFQGTVNVDDKAANPVSLILDSSGKIEFHKEVGNHKPFNEVIVNRADEVIYRSTLKANATVQIRSGIESKIEAKAKDLEEECLPTKR